MNFFHLIMEADGDPLESFDAGGDAPAEDAPPPADAPAPDQGDDAPPSPVDPAMDEMAGFDDTAPIEDEETDGDGTSEDGTNENQEDQKLSEKANSVLNQALYQRMVKRNQDIENTIESIQQIVPVLPYDIIKSNDVPMNRLKAALEKGQQYVLDKFVDSGYGENLLYYQKLDALYTLLLDEINKNLKKVKLS